MSSDCKGSTTAKALLFLPLGTNVTLGSTSAAWQHLESPQAWGFAWHGSHLHPGTADAVSRPCLPRALGSGSARHEWCHTGCGLENDINTETLLLGFTGLAQAFSPH